MYVSDGDDCTGFCDTFTNPYLILAVLVWLAILTIVFFVFLCAYCCRTMTSESQHNTTSKDKLWKKYNDIDGNKHGKDNGMYAEVEEGMTGF